ncbi:MAG TPA: HisA/HisF-related TIM barrel protein [Gemmata sp.]|nr:HisA/HisF-related TIM barrel protein [Gemmata sp.]
MECRKPRLIPVLDVMNGQVVRAVGGRRHGYRPLTSKLVQSTDPETVAMSLLDATGARELYVADLDALGSFQGLTPLAIDGRPFGAAKSAALGSLFFDPNGVTVNSQGCKPLGRSRSVPIWLDGGFGSGHDIPDLSDLPFLRPVVGFETCPSPDYLRDCLESQSRSCLGFSIDLRDGELIGDWGAWGLRDERDALSLARMVVQMGCCHLIVLDLARVGTGTGCGTESLLQAIRVEYPEVELIAGGGIKSWEDIDRLGECGVDGVLVASALHDGRITVPRPVSPSPHQ